jgi:hypothetical protein
MIEDIEINNFRCFDRLKVSGCKRINLISRRRVGTAHKSVNLS